MQLVSELAKWSPPQFLGFFLFRCGQSESEDDKAADEAVNKSGSSCPNILSSQGQTSRAMAVNAQGARTLHAIFP